MNGEFDIKAKSGLAICAFRYKRKSKTTLICCRVCKIVTVPILSSLTPIHTTSSQRCVMTFPRGKEYSQDIHTPAIVHKYDRNDFKLNIKSEYNLYYSSLLK